MTKNPDQNGIRAIMARLPGILLAALCAGMLVACGGGGAGSENSNLNGGSSSGGTPAPTLSLSASPTNVSSGGSSTLTWSSTNATSCTASGAWSGSKPTSGTQSTGALTSDKTYILACTGSGGTAQVSVSVTVTTQLLTLAFSANPMSVASGGSSTLTWSTTNATSCTASGVWSGAKAISGSEPTGALTSDKTYTLKCDGTGSSITKSVTVSVYTPPPPGSSPSMPSLDDERNTYRRWGWTWTTDLEPAAVREPIANYTVTDPDIHQDTEGDDLWSYLMMYQRTGNTVYYNRAAAWARYFKEDYRRCTGSSSYTFCYDRDGYLMDHLYGWGLVAWYEFTCNTSSCDTQALSEAENIAAEVEAYWNQTDSANQPKFVAGTTSMAYYGLRQGARHLLLATRVAEATQKQRWINLRDKLVDLWLRSPDWDSRGMYFFGDWQTNYELGAGMYEQGAREMSTFQIGILTEAFDHAYRTTGRAELRDRMVSMARFVDQYGIDPIYQYSGSRFGIVNGSIWHNYFSSGTPTFCDSVYTTSLVNTLVRGYKYTGDTSFYYRAKHFFNRGTKGVYGSECPTRRTASDTAVHHFVDTRFAGGGFFLDYNKGELQYTYLLFENGGL